MGMGHMHTETGVAPAARHDAHLPIRRPGSARARRCGPGGLARRGCAADPRRRRRGRAADAAAARTRGGVDAHVQPWFFYVF
ncbi:hypothetical protein PVAP13_8NG079405 [Panicum virgatum]|uniref:Uncharacterized protein n=1 Tax=Panicum virgatum TaxID=38727 RepID=A0A8T0P637_PANVG|nr:hypothetical protein PVAP13_8NG079405 [Panicum virgatum]